MTKSNLEEKRVYLDYISRSQSITEGHNGRNSRQELETETWKSAAYRLACRLQAETVCLLLFLTKS